MNVVFLCVILGPKFLFPVQEPVLFSSTLRFNLDPGGRHTDDQIRRALELAGLPDIAAAPGALDQVHIRGSSCFPAAIRKLIILYFPIRIQFWTFGSKKLMCILQKMTQRKTDIIFFFQKTKF
jgi:hypothetical protein